METATIYMSTPVGVLKIRGTAAYIDALHFMDEADGLDCEEAPPLLLQCRQQLQEYFDGERQVFDLPVVQPGSEFQQRVWQELLHIPYGVTISYLQQAKRLGDPKSIRAVGTTNGKNQLAIVVPCHRVIGSDGALTGYAGGVWRKRWLLDHERRVRYGDLRLF
ncbi:methylated-DNA--[protein]-cysteine S-methyltransferase [Chitinophaga pendula]|uniref:methylated-DNA--[protein]-cysteine S-methyltransferase n=1 Tax=Chitinophaga TaxID=79328 RepID=UPI000BB09832|nr:MULTISPECIES: methylated-DNA--[protein]-cysteine S-methyltransferase [Chitinophaga]ASZ13760.1 cysteine methyltransferase [Chitinophaga sp. MD30]UCJ08620.1 methylated-DNA--[protein]-cysteine S-methyltransferase [Chitinophaga pendula]